MIVDRLVKLFLNETKRANIDILALIPRWVLTMNYFEVQGNTGLANIDPSYKLRKGQGCNCEKFVLKYLFYKRVPCNIW